MDDSGRVEVCWLFSMTRSGSSVAAYAAAWPWRVAVADEVLTSFEDRTKEPYCYPAEQAELRSLYEASGKRLTPEVCALAEVVFAKIARREDPAATRVVSKHPHTLIGADEFRAALPRHRAVHLLRNPLHRLNSIYRRGWHAIEGEGFDLERFKAVARRWEAGEHRVVFDDLKRDPAGFFGAMWRAWGWAYGPEHVEAAVEYQKTRYHASSAKLSPKKRPERLYSEARMALPREAVEAYLGDGYVRGLMERVGWETRAEAYVDGEGDGGE
ncbi:MAG: sulfotransferase [Phycisphaerales bacterium]